MTAGHGAPEARVCAGRRDERQGVPVQWPQPGERAALVRRGEAAMPREGSWLGAGGSRCPHVAPPAPGLGLLPGGCGARPPRRGGAGMGQSGSRPGWVLSGGAGR